MEKKEDINKISDLLKTLNEGLDEADWTAAEGFHTLSTVTLGNGGVNFELGSGIVVKVFVNKRTGELKTYYYESVLSDGENQ